MKDSDAGREMPDNRNSCPECGTPLPGDALGGLCPGCLLQQGFSGESASGEKPRAFTPPTPEELAGFFPQFEIYQLIGRGGMGAVYKARQKQLDRIVALKILPPGIGDDAAFAERFTREARALAKLNHPGIVTIHDFGIAEASDERPDRLYFFVMEFVDGVTLRQLLSGGRVSPREALAIVPQICDALQFAHDHGIVHRDIKPENILLDRRGRVKVADFGLAKLVGPKSLELTGRGEQKIGVPKHLPHITEANKVMGTPNYMAPEQKERPAEVDHRADIYALGVVFYQMLTGELPGKVMEPPSSKVQIDVRLDEIVLKALAQDPELRYTQASSLKTDVETILSREPGNARAGESGTQRSVKPDAGLWSPFQSRMVCEICAHLTPVEKKDAQLRAVFWGFWCVLSAIALNLALSKWQDSRQWLYLLGFGMAQAIVIPVWLRMQRQALASTEWARSRGIEASSLRLFSFSGGATGQDSSDDSQVNSSPISLTIIAVLFFVSGCFSAWDMMAGIPDRRYNISFGVLGIAIGIGLLRHRPWWRRVALAWIVFALIGVVVVAFLAFANSLFPVVTVSLFGHELQGTAKIIGMIVVTIGFIVLFAWMYRVLRRADVRNLFRTQGFDRPWVEWSVLAFVLLLCALPLAFKQVAPAGFSSGMPPHPVSTNASHYIKPESIREFEGPPFVAYYPNGGRIELLAIRTKPSGQTNWWRLDGSPSEYDPGIDVEWEGALRQGVLALARHTVATNRPGMAGVSSGFPLFLAVKNGRRVPHDEYGVIPFEQALPEGNTTTLSLKVATSDFQVLNVQKPGRWAKFISTGEWKFSESASGNLVVSMDNVLLDSDIEYRLVAVDVAGQEHLPSATKITRRNGGLWAEYEATYGGSVSGRTIGRLPLSRVKEVRWIARPYQQIHFRNVSLEPGHLTTVQVQDFGKPEHDSHSKQDSAASRKSDEGFVEYSVNKAWSELALKPGTDTPETLQAKLALQLLESDPATAMNRYCWDSPFLPAGSMTIRISDSDKEKTLQSRTLKVIVFEQEIAGIIAKQRNEVDEEQIIVFLAAKRDGEWKRLLETLSPQTNTLAEAEAIFRANAKEIQRKFRALPPRLDPAEQLRQTMNVASAILSDTVQQFSQTVLTQTVFSIPQFTVVPGQDRTSATNGRAKRAPEPGASNPEK